MTVIPDPTFAITGDSGFSIGPARWRDVRAARRVQRLAFRPGLAYGWAALGTLWMLPSAFFLAARDDATGAVIGVGIGDRHRGDLRIMNLAVDPDYRRRGVGRALIRALEAEHPGGNVTLMVEQGNVGAQALYVDEGFAEVGFAKDAYGRGKHGLWMKKTRTGDSPRTIYTRARHKRHDHLLEIAPKTNNKNCQSLLC